MRKEIYLAFRNRASYGRVDNTPILEEILRLRKDVAQLLGYDNYAQMVLQQNMVGAREVEGVV